MNLSNLRKKENLPELIWFVTLWLQFIALLILNTPRYRFWAFRSAEIMHYLAWALGLYKLYFLDHHDKKTLCFATAILIFAFADTFNSELFFERKDLLNLFLLVLSCKGISFRRICRHYLVFYVIFLCQNLLFCALGMKTEIWWGKRMLLPFMPLNMFVLGFTHYNALGMWIMGMIMLSMLVLYKHKTAYIYLIGLAASLLLFYLTASRTSFVISVLSVCFHYVLYRYPKLMERVPKLSLCTALIIVGAIAFMFAITIFYDGSSSVFAWIPDSFHLRLAYGQECIFGPGLRLLGQTEALPDFLDFMFLNIAYHHGAACSAIFAVLLILSAGRAIETKQWDVWILVILITFYSLSEFGMQTPTMMLLYPAFAKLDE